MKQIQRTSTHGRCRPAAWARVGTLIAAIALTAAHAQPKTKDSEQRLQQRLRKFPAADANGDGVLTEDEARSHQRTLKLAGTAKSAKNAEPVAAPAFANVAYGPHIRNVLDFWPAAGPGPRPVLVFFHGGSFKAGDKSAVLARPSFAPCLRAGISVVSANYRFSSDAPFPAPMHDGARVVQFVRSMAREWNIDPARIAVSGSSAGATLALWIALHDDLADPASVDPVARLSTRVICASPHSGTAGLEPEYFKRQAGVTKLGAALFQLFGTASLAELEMPEKRALTREASPLHHATPDDPALYLTYAGDPAEAPFKSDAPQSAWIHHASLGQPLKTKYDTLGLPCEFHHAARPAAEGAEMAFLKKHLIREAAVARP